MLPGRPVVSPGSGCPNFGPRATSDHFAWACGASGAFSRRAPRHPRLGTESACYLSSGCGANSGRIRATLVVRLVGSWTVAALARARCCGRRCGRSRSSRADPAPRSNKKGSSAFARGRPGVRLTSVSRDDLLAFLGPARYLSFPARSLARNPMSGVTRDDVADRSGAFITGVLPNIRARRTTHRPKPISESRVSGNVPVLRIFWPPPPSSLWSTTRGTPLDTPTQGRGTC